MGSRHRHHRSPRERRATSRPRDRWPATYTHAVVLSLAEGWSAAELYVQHAADDVDPDGVAIRFEGTRWKVDDIGGDQAVARIPG